MNIPPISPVAQPGAPASPPAADPATKVAQNFEAILLRQFLSESMKPLLEGGPGGQVYGYLLTETLADSMSKAGGLGLSSILQSQFSKGAHQ
jgi:peptidoglycan hydrolase FlgJ